MRARGTSCLGHVAMGGPGRGWEHSLTALQAEVSAFRQAVRPPICASVGLSAVQPRGAPPTEAPHPAAAAASEAAALQVFQLALLHFPRGWFPVIVSL